MVYIKDPALRKLNPADVPTIKWQKLSFVTCARATFQNKFNKFWGSALCDVMGEEHKSCLL